MESHNAGRVSLQVHNTVLNLSQLVTDSLFVCCWWFLCFRYYLYNLAFQRWRLFVSLQVEKKSKIQHAKSFGKILDLVALHLLHVTSQSAVLSFITLFPYLADRQRMRLALDGWEVFTEMRQMKNRMLESALEMNRLTTLQYDHCIYKSDIHL